MNVYAATKNSGKIRELRAIFANCELDVVTYPPYVDPPEGESSYAENASLKARTLFAQLRTVGISGAVLGDDSGLEVAALRGAPGVLSARYAGIDASWRQRRARLLCEIANARDRSAKFVCAMALILPDGRELAAYGEAYGRIAAHEDGCSGFGYDPIFVDVASELTFAQLDEDQKNRISHRGRAAAGLLAAIAHV